jgi:hypothetical protein
MPIVALRCRFFVPLTSLPSPFAANRAASLSHAGCRFPATLPLNGFPASAIRPQGLHHAPVTGAGEAPTNVTGWLMDITSSSLDELLRYAELDLSAERQTALTPMLQVVIASVTAVRAEEVDEVPPATAFDARWT